jgi:hypothetical protein
MKSKRKRYFWQGEEFKLYSIALLLLILLIVIVASALIFYYMTYQVELLRGENMISGAYYLAGV